MKRAFIAILGFIIVVCAVLWLMGKNMREVRTEIEISATPTEVWEVLMDINGWAEWSPIINKSVGASTLGSSPEITMIGKESDQDGPKYNPTVTISEAPELFRWRAKLGAGFIFTNDKEFTLTETNLGTELVHKELFGGMLTPLFWSSVEKNVPAMLDSMNQALKTRVENKDR